MDLLLDTVLYGIEAGTISIKTGCIPISHT
jgi:hypothetical protein